jgi:hypothetical protein
MTCYLSEGADVREGDRLQFNGETYTIDGAPRVWPGAFRCGHIQVNLKRWSG